MSFALIVTGATQAIGGTIKAIDGAQKAKKAASAARVAKQELDAQKEMFKGLDTSNPYLNLENAFEDLTVNTQEAEFQKQQQMQQQANIMQGMRGAAGGSGVAALAQTLASQGALNAQKASASIGAQEAANQEKMATEQGRIAGMEREGELISRQAEMGKVESLMGMSADELATQREAQRLAEQQKAAGIQQGIAGVGNVAMGGISKATGDKQILEDAKAAEEKRLADERRAAKAAEGTN
tara:strand:+ start:412 stop:1131 length:720 start_codon:yes stop_codon:yes gene_type:complete